MSTTVGIEKVARARVRARRALPPPSERRAIRLASNISLQEVGTAVGVTPQAIGMWETGERTPSAEYVGRYVDVLNALKAVLGDRA